MIVKAVFLFLAGMGVLAMFGKLRLPGQKLLTKRCAKCGRLMLGKDKCSCGKDDT
ncbi:short-chain dehydrogenase [Actibacterium mucosum KCTC 23349]|uniref:Short-chain dehydrogenase n=1 Tax=Actibacterium mucosum KCTC 23349 TaxID=1454373 RepID=A0A037ZEL7_9RHOB|nr:short-chain dehydrogenase [Actibacterium mucosum KCTC 23349]